MHEMLLLFFPITADQTKASPDLQFAVVIMLFDV